MKSLTVRQRQVRGALIIDLEGGILLGETSRRLHDAIRRAVADRKRDIILNLAKVTRIDSSGIGEIISGHAAVKDSGGALKLSNLPPSIAKPVSMTKLLTVFEVYEDERSAVDSFEDDKERLESDGEHSNARVEQELPENFEADAMARSSIH